MTIYYANKQYTADVNQDAYGQITVRYLDIINSISKIIVSLFTKTFDENVNITFYSWIFEKKCIQKSFLLMYNTGNESLRCVYCRKLNKTPHSGTVTYYKCLLYSYPQKLPTFINIWKVNQLARN